MNPQCKYEYKETERNKNIFKVYTPPDHRLSNNCCIVFQKHIKKIKLSYLHQIKAGYIQVTLFTVNTLFFAFLHNPNIICKSENMHANVSQKKQVCRTIC